MKFSMSGESSHKLLLKQTVDAVHPLSEDDFEAFYALFKPFSAKRKEILTYEGTTERYLYFVIEGLQRMYYADENGREATLVFSYTGNFACILDSMLSQSPSKYYFETLSQSRFLRTTYQQIEDLFRTNPNIEMLLQKGLLGGFSGLLERLVELQSFTSEDKFRQLLKRSPHILQIVPHKYLANYIGIDASNFSKLINSVQI
ncbi:Crp/Fnr family transcriptional regulator [Emticicia oligotrophica]|uniref:Crp/Fnr family transcriptional regulator n=2 Tax=Leadbetterellaceae TaxID=3141702 RepID=UPI00273B0EE1|nr:Crp/Fnr family transcriptional regulator [Emticicia oligotrophica]